MEDTRTRLLALREELQRRLGKTQSDERRETAGDNDSNAQLWEASEIRDGLDDEAVGELRQVNRALERLNAGTYGICTGCEEPIDARRLEAMPFAELCIACAEQA
jgi:RNA polymerase-binding transcription factor DksA